MHSATLRYAQPQLDRAPLRKPAARGASRLVAEQPLAARRPKADLSGLKRLLWPLLLLALGLGTYTLAQRVLPYADRPISQVSVQGELSYISQQAVQQRIAPYISASFFTVDLAAMRSELEQMPWIAHAEVRRIWPDQLSIQLEEQLPVARWGNEALLNNQGQAFTPRELANYENLPQLFGPQRAQQTVMQQYQLFSQMLRPLGFSVAQLELRERGSWFLTTGVNSSGQSIELLLGRDHLLEKMRRFVAVYEKTLKPEIANIAHIDLRYANGLAVGWRQPLLGAATNVVAAK
ncbi:MAG: cell division protein FtsQ/DivIB [Pseudomonas sp.]|uniref:cell division protein FtsQ/DivIB n=1 Tax=Pseudomonas sp. TaxID=306 RepID=UPI002732E45E|nr:cell division protein FtsQ/DivIB [Pseudomonas sp.]MDP3846416.1 cell division protein FtsQ/DivIB [Pseudomonas sp.]